MIILSIETSCDETSAAIIKKDKNDKKAKILSISTASSIALHEKTGGIIPERAAREQAKYIMPVCLTALLKYQDIFKANPAEKKDYKIKINSVAFRNANKILREKIDAISVTVGPGLIGSLLIGVETAKTFSYILNKPLIPVNHLLSHLYANFIEKLKTAKTKEKEIKFPFVGLIVSGGHTDLLVFKSHKTFKWLGGTRDDAAGEALDKIGRLINIDYPAGGEIEKMAQKVIKTGIRFKSPMITNSNYDFSFSGLKTEAFRFIKKQNKISQELKNEICFAVQKAIFDVLVKKTLKAAYEHNAKSILIGGGVATNEKLRKQFKLTIKNSKLKMEFFAPKKTLCTDNAAMVGAYALFNPITKPWQKVKSRPDLYFSDKRLSKQNAAGPFPYDRIS